MNEIHFEYEGKAARLSLQSLKREKPQPAVRRRTSTGDVSIFRVFNGHSQSIDKAKLTPDDLINGDPELEIERGGILPELELFTPAYLLPGENAKIADEFSEIEIVHTPEGEEKERRPRMLRSSNINDIHPIKLYGVAKRLYQKKEVALLGAGPKGNAPLVLRDKGSPHRAFLYGELGVGADSDQYRLLLLLSNQELKLPQKVK